MSYLPFIVESTRPKAVGTAAKTVACKVFDAHQRLVEGSVVHRQTCNDQVRVIMGTPYTEELDQMVYCSMVYYNINNSFEPRLKLDVAKALTIEHGTFGFGHVSISGDFPIYQRNQLVKSIERAKVMLQLRENWDDDGARPVAKQTFDRAVMVLFDLVYTVFHKSGKLLHTPSLHPDSDGSVNILFYSDFQLLINVKSDKEMATYYAENEKGESIGGTINASKIKEGFAIAIADIVK